MKSWKIFMSCHSHEMMSALSPSKFHRRNQRDSWLSLGKANKGGQIWTRVNKTKGKTKVWDHIRVKGNWMPSSPSCLLVPFQMGWGKVVKPCPPWQFYLLLVNIRVFSSFLCSSVTLAAHWNHLENFLKIWYQEPPPETRSQLFLGRD